MKNPFLYLYPRRCALCHRPISLKSETDLCQSCAEELPRIKAPRCRVCGKPMTSEFAMPYCADCAKGRPFEKCFVPFIYTGGVQHGILTLKYSGRSGSFRFFAHEIAAEIGDFRPDFITYVPQNIFSFRRRGYNQTFLIAKELGRLLKVPVKGALIRSMSGSHQVGLSESERRKNAKKLYRPKKKRLSGTWLLVDDVITTGATMDTCCGLLRKMGCERVYAAAAAKRVKYI